MLWRRKMKTTKDALENAELLLQSIEINPSDPTIEKLIAVLTELIEVEKAHSTMIARYMLPMIKILEAKAPHETLSIDQS